MERSHGDAPGQAAAFHSQDPAGASAPGPVAEFDPFAGGPLLRAVPTTEAQREVWLADQLGREASLAYNESISLRLRGELDRTALEAAVNDVIARHEALRATLSADGMQFLVAQAQAVAIASHATSGVEALAQATDDAVRSPFDLVRGPLLRATLVQSDADEHVLLLAAHHIVCDGFSFGVVARDLAQAYNARRTQRAPEWSAAAGFCDFALAELAHQDSDERAAAERYWLERFATLPAPLELPTDRPRPARRTFASERIDHVLDADLVAAAKRAAGRDGGSLFGLLLATFGVLVARLAQQDEVVIGVPAAGQNAVGSSDLVGHCVNLLPLRLSFDPACSAQAMLRATQSALLDSFDHQRFTFGSLLRKLAIERDPARLPLVSVMFNLDQALDGAALGFEGLHSAVDGTPRRFENFELFVNATQVGGALRLECQYNVALFDAASVRGWLASYETLLRAWIDAPQTACGALPWVPQEQRARLHELNDRTVPYDHSATLAPVLRAALTRAGQQTVLIAGDERLSGAQLLQRAEQLARALRMRGARRGARVGLHLPRTANLVVAQLAVLFSGAAYVPLDPAFPDERLQMMADDAELALIVSTAAGRERLDWRHERCLLLDADNAFADSAAIVDLVKEDAATADDPAYVIYTSGSTGKPKGVVVPQRAVVNFLFSMADRPGMRATDTLVAVTTLSFDIAVLELLLPLIAGARVVLATREQAADGTALSALINAQSANVLQATPATWLMVLHAGFAPQLGFKALVGGEALPADLARELLTRGCEVWNMYGPTETTVWSTCEAVTDADAPISIGTPIANTRVWILDERQQLCPIGVPGEICIGGDGVTLGYHRRPELTADRFVADPFGPAPARLYRTGDRGRWTHQGKLQHLGRLDFQVKVRGYRIELGEIEAQLASHPDVEQCVAITREDRPTDVRIVAYVVARGTPPAASKLREHLRRTLPDYMIPQHFVALAHLPRLPNGKLDRRRLPPPQEAPRASRVSDGSAAERQVAAAIAAALSLPEVGVDDNFFALGGHSLLAAQLVTTLSGAMRCTVPLRAVFDAPTARQLTAWIERERHGTAAAVDHIEVHPGRTFAPLSAMQQRLWFLEQLRPGRPVHNVPSGHRLLGPLDEAAFQRAFARMVARQNVLRTVIEMRDGEPVQRVLDQIDVSLFPAEDLSAIAPTDRDQALAQRMSELVSTPFDLDGQPLVRVRMFKLAPLEHALFFMAHHLIWDGWSFDLLYREMAALYAEECGAGPAVLPPLTVSYGDFAQWQQQWLSSQEAKRQVTHWKEILTGYDGVLELPTDHARPPVQSGRGHTAWIDVDEDTTERLHGLARHSDTTIFVVLLAAFTASLRHLTGQSDLVIATPVRGRQRPELEGLMGFFVNALPLRLRSTAASPTVGTLLAEVRDTVRRSFDSPDVPFEHLVRELKLRRTEDRFPLYQAFMSFQDGRGRPTRWGQLEHRPDFVRSGVSNEDIGLWLMQRHHGLSGALVANADIVSEASVATMRNFVVALLQQMARAEAATSLASLSDAAARVAALPTTWLEHTERVRAAGALGAAPPPSAPVIAARNPSTPDEIKLAQIWAELLGVNDVQATDNFFDLGGHSLLVMRAISEMERQMGRRVSPRRYIFETLQQIAARGLEEQQAPAAKPKSMLGRLVGSLAGRRTS